MVPKIAIEVVDEAMGRSRRSDAVTGRTGGAAGNARLTAWTGLLLLVLLLAELVTLLDVRGLISWHVVIGVLLVPPALLKTAVTGWRMLRYYTRGEKYRMAGPPVLLLRVLGPFVILATLALLGSGLTLIALGQQRARGSAVPLFGDWVSLHQTVAIVFYVVVGLHLLARIVPALKLVLARRKENIGVAGRVPGRTARLAVLVLTVAVAAVTAALILPGAASWKNDQFGPSDRPPGAATHP
jgi:hypothetical protein